MSIPDINQQRSNNLYDLFCQTATQFPDHPALLGDGGKGKKYFYREALSIIQELATGLSKSPLADHQEIGLISENRPEWALVYLAIVASGKTAVPIDVNLKPPEVAGIISHSRLKLIFSSRKSIQLFEKAMTGATILSFDDEQDNWLSIVEKTDRFNSSAKLDAVAVLIYTSGTTGSPKAVMLTHRNLMSNLSGISQVFHFDYNDIFLSVLPLHHTFEATCGFLTPITTGCTIAYARSLKSRDILEDLSYTKATVMCGVPLLYEKMHQAIQRGINAAPIHSKALFHILFFLSSFGWKLKKKWGVVLFNPLRSKAKLGHIRKFVSGGAALPPYISRFFNLLGFDMLQGYGLTECSPVVTANRVDDIRFPSVGPPLYGIKLKINNPNKEGIGEILVQGDNVTPGYKDNQKQTNELLKEGWLYTGDLGKLAKGHLWITGRAKNLIISAAGKNIYPEELEEKVMESPLVSEIVVFGRPKSDRHGEEVRALIVPDIEEFEFVTSNLLSESDKEKIKKMIADLISEVNNHVADYKKIVRFDIQYDELEKTSTKKVKRFVYSSKFKK